MFEVWFIYKTVFYEQCCSSLYSDVFVIRLFCKKTRVFIRFVKKSIKLIDGNGIKFQTCLFIIIDAILSK